MLCASVLQASCYVPLLMLSGHCLLSAVLPMALTAVTRRSLVTGSMWVQP
jgi:hypothetical protein